MLFVFELNYIIMQATDLSKRTCMPSRRENKMAAFLRRKSIVEEFSWITKV